ASRPWTAAWPWWRSRAWTRPTTSSPHTLASGRCRSTSEEAVREQCGPLAPGLLEPAQGPDQLVAGAERLLGPLEQAHQAQRAADPLAARVAGSDPAELGGEPGRVPGVAGGVQAAPDGREALIRLRVPAEVEQLLGRAQLRSGQLRRRRLGRRGLG